MEDKNRKRAIRRANKKRVGKKAFKNHHDVHDPWTKKYMDEHPYWRSECEGALSSTRAACSGACCGNPRKHFNEKTIQERKAEEDFEDQMEETLGEGE